MTSLERISCAAFVKIVLNRRTTVGLSVALAFLIAGLDLDAAAAQTTLTPWGNLAGMRVSGEAVDFEAGLRIVHPNWTGFSSAVKYLQRPRYSRTGTQTVVESEIEGITFKEVLEDAEPGKTTIALQVTARTNLAMAGAYHCVDLPDAEFVGGDLQLIRNGVTLPSDLKLDPVAFTDRKEYLRQTATGVKITAVRRALELRWNEPRVIVVRRDMSDRPTSLNDPSVRQRFVASSPNPRHCGYQLYLEVLAGDASPGRSATITLNLTAGATPDPQPVKLTLDSSKPGQAFDGIGGNFRLQFPKTDPAVLQYNLDNLRVAWGRVDMPWAEWDPEEQADPVLASPTRQLDAKVSEAMQTARTLAQRHIPVIISAWSPPLWARATSQPAGLRGTALNTSKLDRICSSLASYLVFLKEHREVEARFFSFNEPETGVEVRQTAAEHVQFIKQMGAELVKRGLSTKLLLGDTAQGTPTALDFIRPCLADPAAHQYIGAVAFHTWRGCTEESLHAWADAARELSVPLLITEAGPDAHLHEYPGLRLEPWFQLQEIELYVRCCAYGQPATIMEWQLTTDYSVLTGGGVYGESGRLKPTQRFWNLKQLGATSAGALALPIASDRPDVTVAAFGDPANGSYAVHMVNRGNERPAQLGGLPESLTTLRRFITDADRGMAEERPVAVRSGKAEFILPPASYTTLLGSKVTAAQPRTGASGQ